MKFRTGTSEVILYVSNEINTQGLEFNDVIFVK